MDQIKVEFLKDWNLYTPGQRAEFGRNISSLLIQSGRAKLVEDPEPTDKMIRIKKAPKRRKRQVTTKKVN